MKSPYRDRILKMLESSDMSAAQVAEGLGKGREGTYKVLEKMAKAGFISMEKRGTSTLWTKYRRPAAKDPQPERVNNGTSRAPLTDLGFTYPSRAGAMDAYAIRSKFHRSNP